MNDDTVDGAFACSTASRSPTSIASSSVEVQTMQAFVPRANLASAARLFERHGRMMDENVDRAAAHALGHGLGEGPRLAKEEAFLSGRSRRRLVGERDDAIVQPDGDVLLAGFLGRSTTTPSRRDVPLIHSRILSGFPTVAESRCVARRSSSLARCARGTASSMRAAVGSSQRVDLIDDDDAQVLEQLRHRRLRRDEHHLQRLRRRHAREAGARLQRAKSQLRRNPALARGGLM